MTDSKPPPADEDDADSKPPPADEDHAFPILNERARVVLDPAELMHDDEPTTKPSARLFVRHQQTSFSGPLPPPDMLAGYEQLAPGTADLLLKDYLESKAAESEHRRKRETADDAFVDNLRKSETKTQRYGILAAVTVSLAITAGGVLLGGPAGAVVLSTVPVGLVAVFIYGTRAKGDSKPPPQLFPNSPPELPPSGGGSPSEPDE